MSKECYQDFAFKPATLAIIEIADKIMVEYAADGYDLTLRQLYYQFVARDIIPNSQREYKRLGDMISNGRLAGLLDWDNLVDRTRVLYGTPTYSGPKSFLDRKVEGYALDTRQDQDYHIECWVEKEALRQVLQRACMPLDVDYFACKGYVSQSAMYRAAERMKWAEDEGKETVILHLGDHDPSGIDMSRDIQERLHLFGCHTQVNRIALTMEQVDELNPPPNPAKLTDSRCEKYIAEYGDESWELDALEPQYIRDLIDEHVDSLTDLDRRNVWLDRQEQERESIREFADTFEE